MLYKTYEIQSRYIPLKSYIRCVFSRCRKNKQNTFKKLLTISVFYEIMRSNKLSIQNNYTLPNRVRRCIECSEHISPRNVRERWSMALEREWLPQTAEKFSREDAQKAELVSRTKIELWRWELRSAYLGRLFAIFADLFLQSDLRNTLSDGLLRRFLFSEA